MTLRQIALHHARAAGSGDPREVWAQVTEATRSGTPGVRRSRFSTGTAPWFSRRIPELVGQSRADTNIFRRLSAEADAGLAADPPVRGRQSGQLVIPFGRKLQDPDGSFAGALVAALEPERLRGFYRTIDVGKKGYIWVMHPVWGVLFREPSPVVSDADGEPPAARAPQGHLAVGLCAGAVRTRRAGLFQRVSPHRRSADVDRGFAGQKRNPLRVVEGRGHFGQHRGGVRHSLLFAWRMFAREIRARDEAERRNIEQAKALAAATSRHEEADAACGRRKRNSSRSWTTRP